MTNLTTYAPATLDTPTLCPNCAEAVRDTIAITRKRLNPLPDEHRFLKPAELGDALRRSRAWTYAQIQAGRIPVVTVDGSLRVRVSDALKFIDSITAGGAR